ncbi:hypothetical protein CROQUDRAFT_100103 [Cronartium quercuum f. sp. fusiforme G11]|uniref:RNase H type-1 domain-containing protein n=1 Tax=Cronartium quercuum f. sp. fusiforme G11 TaxID=708437 RepID=A0A9P6T5Z5_9BASI|nr:hypothetical protein CROQUDRAFT_100103 [Cronartium quercuum f. sp. fusiforme G11]
MDERTNDALVVFTDGSYLQDTGGGAAAASLDEIRMATFTPPAAFSNNEMELMGITLGVAHDSQAALRATHFPVQPKSGQSLVKFLKHQLRQLPEDATIYLYWTPGHEGIPLNEKADTAAKRAAKEEGRKTHLPTSLTNLLQATWNSLTIPSSEFPSHTPSFKTTAKRIADAFNILEKGQAAAIFQLRTGHCPLNAYLHRFKRTTTKYRGTCGVPETVSHFLLYCRKYRSQRKAFRLRVKTEKLRTNVHNTNAISDDPKVFPFLAQYVLDTGRFEHLFSYFPEED